MKPSTKWALIFFTISLFVSAANISYSTYNFSEMLKWQIENNLHSLSESKARHVVGFLDEQKEKVELAGKNLILENFLRSEEKSPEDVEIVKQELEEILHGKFMFIHINDAHRNIVLSTNNPLTSLEKISHEEKIGTSEGVSIHMFYASSLKNNILMLTTSIFDTETSETIGSLSAHVNMEELNYILKERENVGKWKTEETYLVNDKGLLLTPSIFLRGDNRGVLTQAVSTPNAQECLEDLGEKGQAAFDAEFEEKKTGDLIFSLSYQGQQIIGTDFPIPELNWCLLAEVGYEEAFADPLKGFVVQSAIFAGAVILVLTLIGFYAGSGLDRKLGRKKKGRRNKR